MGDEPRRTRQNGFGMVMKHDLIQAKQPRLAREFAEFHCTLTIQLIAAIVYLIKKRRIVRLSILHRTHLRSFQEVASRLSRS